MARLSIPSTAPETVEVGLYRNRTKVTQVFYPNGEKIIVDADCTVELPVKYGAKYTLYLDRLDTPVAE